MSFFCHKANSGGARVPSARAVYPNVRPCRTSKRSRGMSARKCLIYWQEWRNSNPQPPVLETGALAIELHS